MGKKSPIDQETLVFKNIQLFYMFSFGTMSREVLLVTEIEQPLT